MKKLPDHKYRIGVSQHVEMINCGWSGYPFNEEYVHNKLYECEVKDLPFFDLNKNLPREILT